MEPGILRLSWSVTRSRLEVRPSELTWDRSSSADERGLLQEEIQSPVGSV